MKFPEKIVINLTDEDLQGDYTNDSYCPIARAMRRHFGERKMISVNCTGVSIIDTDSNKFAFYEEKNFKEFNCNSNIKSIQADLGLLDESETEFYANSTRPLSRRIEFWKTL